MNNTWELDLAERIRHARTVGDVDDIIKQAIDRYGARWRPVGDRENNIGTIRMGSDPGLALVERITNGIDSLLELGAALNPDADVSSPEEAARAFYSVPADGLGGMTESQRRTLAENITVTMHDSGVKQRPTIAVDDRGIGQLADAFPKTLMSLNESNKVGLAYTMGTYGQGGSVTYGFSKATVIASRRHPKFLGGADDLVGWTVVVEQETDPTKNILPRYVYLVGADGEPLRLPPSCFPDLAHGTSITHVEYDVQRLQGPFTTQMWQFLHAALFEPVLPFLLGGDRGIDPTKRSGAPDDRVIIGNTARLENVGRAKGDLTLAAHDVHRIELGSEYGNVVVSWWALTRPESSSSSGDPAAAYVQAGTAVTLSLHGQRQDTEGRTWIKDRAQMPFLYKNMVVHINANELTPIGRRELFASTRERATESELRKIIYDDVAELIRTDEELKRINHEEKERLLRRSTAATNEKIRKRIGRFIKTRMKDLFKPAPGKAGAAGDTSGARGAGGSNNGSQKGKKKGQRGHGPGRDTDDSALGHVPSYIRFEAPRARVAQGAAGYVWVLIDAKNGYLPSHDDDLSISFDNHRGKVRVRSRSKLIGGRSRWAIAADPNVRLGSCTMQVELRTARGLLTAELPVEIKEPPEENKSGRSGRDEDTGPDVRWVTKDSWEDFDWGPRDVGKVDEDADSTIVWVNRDFELLAQALASSKLTADQITLRADRYQFPVACGLWLQHDETKKLKVKPEESYQRAEMARLAEAVLMAMDPDVDLAGVTSEDVA